MGAWAQHRNCWVHQSWRRKLQKIIMTHDLQLELSGPSEELCRGRSSGASVPAAQLHHADSAGFTLHQASILCVTRGSWNTHVSWHSCTAAVRLFPIASALFCRKGVGAGVPLAHPPEAGAKDLPATYQRLRSTKCGVWQGLIVFCERRGCDSFPLCLWIDSLSLLAPWKQAL